jgi:hypothetical protein
MYGDTGIDEGGKALWSARPEVPADSSLQASLCASILDYMLVSSLTISGWGRAISVLFLGAMLVLTLRVSRSRRIWSKAAVAHELHLYSKSI